MARVLLLGMNNPLSDEPRFDLFPYPEGSAGYRLWKMLPDGTRRRDYLAAFERRNLLRAREWDGSAAREAARALLPELAGRVVVVLGTQVRTALDLRPAEPLSFHEEVLGCGRLRWVAFPHPSGRNRWFNQPENRARARELLALLYRASAADAADSAWVG